MKNYLRTCGAKAALLAGFFFQTALSAAPIDDLRALTRDLKSLQGDFTQQTFDAQNKATKTLSGSFTLAKGGKFRWDYEKPYRQVLVSDGSKFATYDADLAQMTVRKLDQSLAATPLAALSGTIAIDSAFALKPLVAADGYEWVGATPKQADAAVNDLRFGFQGAELKALSWIDGFGQRTLMKFATLKRNVATDERAFVFTPPAGTEIVGN